MLSFCNDTGLIETERYRKPRGDNYHQRLNCMSNGVRRQQKKKEKTGWGEKSLFSLIPDFFRFTSGVQKTNWDTQCIPLTASLVRQWSTPVPVGSLLWLVHWRTVDTCLPYFLLSIHLLDLLKSFEDFPR